jgi:arginine decarboxylase
VGPGNCPALRYLQALEAFDRTFPGFQHDVHGIEHDEDGSFLLRVITDERRRETLSRSAERAKRVEGSTRSTVHDARRAPRR